MKKLGTILGMLLFGMCVIFAAGVEEDATYLTEAPTEGAVEIQAIVLKGPTSMGVVSLMDEAKEGPIEGNTYTFSIAGAVDEVTSKLVRGDVDIAAIPSNLASVLYNNTQGAVKVLAINTLGVLYIVESGNAVQSLDDLRGKTIFASGKGATPEYVLQYLLESYGIADEVTIEWKSEHAECVAALSQKPGGIAMLPQPFVTTAMVKNPAIRIALDMTQLWDDLQQTSDAPSTLVTGVVVGRTAFLEQYPQAVASFLDQYEDSVAFVLANTEEAASLIGSFNIVPEAVAARALPYCNITFIEGPEMKTKLSGYLSVLYAQNPKSIGGAMPADEFYYSR